MEESLEWSLSKVGVRDEGQNHRIKWRARSQTRLASRRRTERARVRDRR